MCGFVFCRHRVSGDEGGVMSLQKPSVDKLATENVLINVLIGTANLGVFARQKCAWTNTELSNFCQLSILTASASCAPHLLV